jgi:hypothetical protein
MRHALILRVLAFVLVSLGAVTSHAQVCPGWLALEVRPGTNDLVNATVEWNGRLVAAGRFISAGGVSATGVAIWEGGRWAPLGSGVVGEVLALCVFDNKLIVGGSITFAGGSPVNRIAAWDGASWTPLGSGLSGPVRTLHVHGGKLFAGGNFTKAGSLSVNHIAMWNGTGWSKLGGGASSPVNAIETYGTDLVVAGEFTWLDSGSGVVNASRIARWNGTTWSALGTGLDNTVRGLETFRGELFAVGDFTQAGPTQTKYVASWNGAAWSAVGSGLPSPASSIVVQGDQLFANGTYEVLGSGSRRLAAWDGISWSVLPDVFSDWVNHLGTFEGDLIAAGWVKSVNSWLRVNGIARRRTGEWRAIGSGFDNPVQALETFQGQVFASGGFTTASERAIGGLARWDSREWQPIGQGVFGPVAANDVRALGAYQGKLIAGGSFGKIGGVTANKLATWSGSVWEAIPNSFTESITLVHEHGGELIVAGPIGSWYFGLARWDGQLWRGFGLTRTQTPFAFASYGGALVLGGSGFGDLTSPSSVVQWNGSALVNVGGRVLGFARALAVYDGKLVAGGNLTSANGVTVQNIAQWDGVQWSAMGGGIDRQVNALHVLNGKLYAGTNAGSGGATLKVWDGATWSDVPGAPTSAVFCMTSIGDELVIGGEFGQVNGAPAGYWARYSTTGRPRIVAHPEPLTSSCGDEVRLRVSIASGYSGVSYRWFKNDVELANGSTPGGSVITGSDAVELVISGVTVGDAGEYRCRVSNSCEETLSSSAQITVSGPSCCAADLTSDGLVDDSDFQVFVIAYDLLDCADPGMPAGCSSDLNRDGLVDDLDFQAFVVAYDALGCP